MTDFHNVSFPLALSYGARGGPKRKTDITPLASGAEYRSTPHAGSRRHYDVGVGVKNRNDMETLVAFFEVRRGQLHAFRFRDPLDHLSCAAGSTISTSDQTIGMGDGVTTTFALIKSYSDGEGQYQRPITKPVASTVLTAVNGAPQSAEIDALTGVITFAAPPLNGAEISAGFQFDVPVRFDVDHLELAIEAFGTGEAAHIPLIEVLGHA